jgi:hypothetical protein
MTNVNIAPELYKQVEQLAVERNQRADDVIADAVQHYFRQLQREKIAAESRIYRERHAEIKDKYLGQYIAMRDGEIIDSDTEFQPLHRRIRERFGRLPVLITRVEEAPEHVLVRRGFRLENPKQ